MVIEDISDRYADLGEEDTVYSSASGYVVRVKAFVAPGPDLAHVVRMRGEALDDAGVPTGASREHVLTVQAESPVDLAAEVEAARRKVVAEVERGLIHGAALAALKGVKRAAP